MATYYVDGINGDDSNSGTSKDKAWKTIEKAVSTLTAGDICHIRPGFYNQSSTLHFYNIGTSDNYVEFIGDEEGEIWGEKGRVVIKTTSDIILLRFESSGGPAQYIKFKNISFVRPISSTEYLIHSYNSTHHIEFYNCIFQEGHNSETYSIALEGSYNIMSRCQIFIYRDLRIGACGRIENSLVIITGGSIRDNAEGNQKIYNNIIIASSPLYSFNEGNQEFKNNLVMVGSVGSYNTDFIYSNNIAVASPSSSFWSFGYADIKIKIETGPNGDLLDGGTDVTLTENVDLHNNPRKLKQGIDIGAVEYNPPEEKETTEVRTGSYSLKLTGASFKDIKTFLPAGSYTISVYTKWSGYSGTDKPQLIVKQDKYCGINSDQIATATGDGSDWEQLSVNITLTKDAEITIRLYARDTGSSAVTYFDDLDIS